MKRILKKYLYYFLNDLILYNFGFGIYRRSDSSPSQFKNLFYPNKKKFKLIDCGSYHGSFTKEFNRIFNNSECLCFEPSKLAFSKLSENFKSNKNIQTFNIGLASINRRKKIYINNSDKTNSIFRMDPNIPECQKEFVENKSVQNIELRRLDDFLKKDKNLSRSFSEIDLIKIDVQGAELELLHGAIDTIKNSKYILIEIHFIKSYKSSPIFKDILEFLEKYDFEFQRFYELVVDNQDRTKMIYGDAFFKNTKLL